MRSIIVLAVAMTVNIVSAMPQADEHHPAYDVSDKNVYEVADDHPMVVEINEDGIANLPERDTHFNKREVIPGVYICAGKDWKGPCYWEPVTALDKCHGLRVPLYGFGSFGVDKGIKCKIWAAQSCVDLPSNWSSDWIRFPGIKSKGGDALNLPVTETREFWPYHAYKCQKG